MPAPGYVHPSKRSLSPDELGKYQTLAATGATSSLILEHLGPKLRSRREQIIGEALSRFRTMQLSNEMALRYWAVLSEVAALHEQLLHEEDAGIQAYKQFLEGVNDDSE